MADHHFSDHDRQTQQENETNIKKYETAAAIFTGDIGKSPDIAEADRGADTRHQERRA